MGGFLSTRWNGVRTRQDTGPLLRLDIAVLRRRGALTPGMNSWIHWPNEMGQSAGSIQLKATADTLTLTYRVRDHGEEWCGFREHVDLEWTPCHYGGRRPWFHCPQCDTRRQVLYFLGGWFRCRGCHHLAYTSTREDEYERSACRIASLHVRLGSSANDRFMIPSRPAGMWWSTYQKTVDDLILEHHMQADHFIPFLK